MTRSCAITDDRLIAFADGLDLDIDFDEHVAGCDECQSFLADLWDGELEHDLSEPIVNAIRLELFLMDAAKFGGGIVANMLQAFMRYLDPGIGKEES